MLKAALFLPNSPTLIFPDNHPETIEALQRLRPQLQGVEVMLVASPHFAARGGFFIDSSEQPRFIQDYYGFPQDWYDVRYEPPGAPAVAGALLEAGRKAGLPVELTGEWGIDHGAWTPLLHLAPEADLPVVCLSISDLSPAEHRRWGETIGRTMESLGKTWAFLGTGAPSHRLDLVRFDKEFSFPDGERYDAELILRLEQGRFGEIESIDPQLTIAAAPEGGNGTLYMLLGAVGNHGPARVLAHERLSGAASLLTVSFP